MPCYKPRPFCNGCEEASWVSHGENSNGHIKRKDALSVWESWDFKCGYYYIFTTTFRHGNGERKAFDCTLFPVRQ